MELGFKYLRIFTAITIVAVTVIDFGMALYWQSQSLLDGPLSRPMYYAFSLNKIFLALCLSIVLLFDFDFKLSKFGASALRAMGCLSLIFSLIGFFKIFQQHKFSGFHRAIFSFYSFQFAYVLISIIVILKGMKGASHA
ncbi:hypothetical protein [Fretibacter rubidus]|uniref:hypothetical protein n=1 Tax=Fretibacter rubidus TaxID=570162 RepID=UPI00352A266F